MEFIKQRYFPLLVGCIDCKRQAVVLRLGNMIFMMVLFCWSLLPSSPLFAKDAEDHDFSFVDWQHEFKISALRAGITPETFVAAFDQLKLNETVLRLDKSQPEFSRAIWTYIDNAIANNRIEKGKAILKKHRNLFNEVSKTYKVPAEIIIAIWGMESDFGGNYGNMSVIRSLATLAYGGQRKEFATKELLVALTIMQQEKLQSKALVGSWAGAIGHPQFMPSSFAKYAVDFNYDGKRDLWHSLDDAFASIAHYMQKEGWKENETWGQEVVLPDDFMWQKQAQFNPKDERLTVSEWMLWGVKPVSGKEFENYDQLAALFFPAGQVGPVFLVFDNFDIIKKYNLSLSYSLAVGLLASGIADETEKKNLLVGQWPREDKSLSRDDKILLQTVLNKQGFNAGKVDGKVGSNTRKAIRKWQLNNALAADGYMSQRLFKKIKNSIRE
ncbi:MAG: lytic murein transglycosylase [Cocleimonas sp.]|nr:lytic murein transglycosylase [Cocleimonas sp.]